jgi:hypothetical protein
MGYLRFSEERLSWKSSHRSIASAANRSFSEVGISLSFSQAPFGHSSLTPPPVRNISAGLPARCTIDKMSEHSSPEVLNICCGGRITESIARSSWLMAGVSSSRNPQYPAVHASTQRIHKHKPTSRYRFSSGRLSPDHCPLLEIADQPRIWSRRRVRALAHRSPLVKFLTMAVDRSRNEKSQTADGNISDPIRAYEYLRLSSLAMHLLERGRVGSASATTRQPFQLPKQAYRNA